ncbi:MAG: glycosyltransferase [Rhodospirillales bacterium]|nr:glycosyltransferase [Rhodospirillales bacterium]MDE2576483.1 glycosyltransferase [Rhodospirillales bacterium]
MKIAIVHEWLQSYAGAERVLEQIIVCYPQADLFAVVDFLPPGQRGFLGGRQVTTSFIQRLPFAARHFRAYLGLMPLAVEQFDLSGYDLVISSSHAVAKGVLTGPDTLHVSYVHSPMRYAWDLQHQYLRQSGLERGVKAAYVRWQLSRLRQWDARTANGVDVFIANSAYVARRIRKCYRRSAEVIAPPVDVASFQPGGETGEAYLVASRLVPYKRVDLVVAAFAEMPQRRLVVVGDGPERAAVERAARGAANIVFRGAVGHDELVGLMQTARGFVFAAEEDFGIMLVEAQACGTPVIAFGSGGARDIVADGTGLFFESQSKAAIIDAVERFERQTFSRAACRANAERFGPEVFRARLTGLVEESWARRND